MKQKRKWRKRRLNVGRNRERKEWRREGRDSEILMEEREKEEEEDVMERCGQQ